MAFGPIMQFKVGELQIELAPLTKEAMSEFVNIEHGGGMQRHTITRYLGRGNAPVLEDEFEWFEKTRKEKDTLVWGIWIIGTDNERTLIGGSSLFDFDDGHTKLISQATSGSQIFRPEYWGKGVASAAHKARTWYAFHHLGLHRVKSAVIQANGGSRKALERSGYQLVYTERNEQFSDGQLQHMDCLACLNPSDPFWNQWWHGDRPTRSAIQARKLTREAMEWATTHVTLP